MSLDRYTIAYVKQSEIHFEYENASKERQQKMESFSNVGWGNGYVIIPPTNPCYKRKEIIQKFPCSLRVSYFKHCDPAIIHDAYRFADEGRPYSETSPIFLDPPIDLTTKWWVVGFDTAFTSNKAPDFFTKEEKEEWEKICETHFKKLTMKAVIDLTRDLQSMIESWHED